jgi:hypothetical protein
MEQKQSKGSSMKTKLDIKSMVLGALLGAVIVFSVGAATGGSRTVWEYKTVPGKVFGEELGQAINGAVAQGWEFVSASPSTEQWGFAVMRREKK